MPARHLSRSTRDQHQWKAENVSFRLMLVSSRMASERQRRCARRVLPEMHFRCTPGALQATSGRFWSPCGLPLSAARTCCMATYTWSATAATGCVWRCTSTFHVNGRLRSGQELREYEPPSREQKNSASVWRATGFYLWDFFAKAKGLRRSISRRRPLKGWKGGQCCAMVASYGVWMPKLKELLKEGVATIDDAEAWSPPEVSGLFTSLDAWSSSMFTILRISRATDASKYESLLIAHLARMRAALRKLSDEVLPYSVRTYEHYLFGYAHIRDSGCLIKCSCWVTEHFNIVWKEFLSHHTSHGGGRPRKDGSMQHTNAIVRQCCACVCCTAGSWSR